MQKFCPNNENQKNLVTEASSARVQLTRFLEKSDPEAVRVPLGLNSANGIDSYQFKSKRAQPLSYKTLIPSKRSVIIRNKDQRKLKPKIG